MMFLLRNCENCGAGQCTTPVKYRRRIRAIRLYWVGGSDFVAAFTSGVDEQPELNDKITATDKDKFDRSDRLLLPVLIANT